MQTSLMRVVVLSGGVGTGKSSVLHRLQQGTGAELRLFSADDCVKEAYRDRQVRETVIHAFQDLIEVSEQAALAAEDSGEGLKRWLRGHVLPDRPRRERLEAILHPYVLGRIEAERGLANGNLLVAEVPLHYEIGQVITADLVIVVAASRPVQVRRMMENRGLDEATSQAFLDAQWPVEAKVEKADAVIWNDGDLSALESQTLLFANLLNLE